MCNADSVQENGPELLTTKRLLLQEVSGCVGAHTVVATSTLQRQLVSTIATRFAGRSLRDVTTERDTRLRTILSLTQQPLPQSGNG